ncbi:hexokinase [Microdochium bolleyi]|uniref:Phosphotransferase n=1 Tax=Microdochium bolleyi TaxID=196109 RepID=A0A136IQK7_9PEZI|nr:hexokinase [Microdochium bolleyi]
MITGSGLRTQQPFQLPAYVTSIPDGSEKGTFLAVDLGGTNCRICSVTLHGDGTFDVTQDKCAVPFELRVNENYKPLFAFIATKLAAFLASSAKLGHTTQAAASANTEPYRLGFTFSFACNQTSVAHGTLIHWDKGWDIPDAVGKDPCALLQEAIDDISLPVRVCVLANDSVGTLLTRSYTSGSSARTLAGVIFGTGTNAAYVEQRCNITRISEDANQARGRSADDVMVMNTEWGGLDDDMKVLPKTPYDDKLDTDSTDTGGQMLEKRVSGLYLGELLRLVILDLSGKGTLSLLLDTESPVHVREGVDSSFLSALAQYDDTTDLQQTRGLIAETLAARDVSLEDAQIIRRSAAAIVRRAARLAGTALAAVIIQSDRLPTKEAHARASESSTVVEELSVREGKSIRDLLFNFCNALSLFTRKVLRAVGISRWHSDPASTPAKHGVAPDRQDSNASPDSEMVDIGVDGSLIEFYPGFEDAMREALREVVEIGPEGERRIRIGLAKDGSGVGAALMAQAVGIDNE